LNIVLPVGISFYTFQTLSYTIDVYKRKIPASKSLIDFCAFVSFFPQLVAGPIERASHLLPQFSVKRTFSYENASLGMQQILWGFFKKIVVADNCAEIANHIFDSYQNQNGIVLIIGALAFAFQIYGDFSGYSDIAVGTARLFGFSLMQNFRYPYFSRDIGEFWRRWHISLTTWFRDYVYIPLGGSRVSKLKIARNTFIVFLVSGFWHGANWTFIGWGLFHVILFLPLILFNINRINTNSVAENRIFPNLRELFQILFTFLMVVIGWIFFRSENISSAFEYLQIIFTPDKQYFDWKSIRYGKDVLSNFSMVFSIISVIILLLTEWFHRNKSFGLEIKKSGFNWLIYIGLLLLIFIAKGGNSAFIYFQF
jgi:D-alanyl-lipoteichoic acid acyltransferase DltB (MBOAT superfamily)